MGVLDEAGFERALAEDADGALALLADLTGATDVRLRELARRLAGRLVLDLTRTAKRPTRGIGRMRTVPADRSLGDLDVDASVEALTEARAARRAADVEELRVRDWTRPDTALCLLIDRSGSMGGARLAAAALAAAACAWRAPQDLSVLAFSDKVIVVKDQCTPRPTALVVDDVLSLRGFGPTDLALGLRTAAAQLATSRAGRRLTVLLSDCRPTTGRDPALDAGGLEELAIVAPADDAVDAVAFARQVGASHVTLAGPSDVATAFTELLDR